MTRKICKHCNHVIGEESPIITRYIPFNRTIYFHIKCQTKKTQGDIPTKEIANDKANV